MNNDMPNAPSTATTENASLSDGSIFAKMTAMREQTLRNQIRTAETDETGTSEQAKAEAPVAPDEPEIAEPQAEEAQDTTDAVAPEESLDSEEVTTDDPANSTSDELIDFLEFAETNPRAKFKFMKNGKEMIIDAKRAAAILGQGGAIHEEARQLKIERAEFEEFQRQQKNTQEGLTLAMELTVAPQMQRAYQEIIKTQGYNQVFQEQLARTQDPTEQAKIQANIAQNERYMAQQGELIRRVKPNLDHFRQVRQQQVAEVLENSRKSFKDKELRNEYVYNELREKLAKTWDQAQGETLPGIKNIDLVTADETILGLIRDGLKFRDKPQAKQAGASVAALTRKSGTSSNTKTADDNIVKLREQAKGGDKKAADNLLVAQLNKLRAARTGR